MARTSSGVISHLHRRNDDVPAGPEPAELDVVEIGSAGAEGVAVDSSGAGPQVRVGEKVDNAVL